MNAATKLVPEHVIYQSVLGQAAQAVERRRRYDGIEVVPIAGNLGSGAGNRGLDSLLELVWGHGGSAHLVQA